MTTEAPRTRYRTSSLLPPLIAKVKCATRADVIGWARHANPSFAHKTGLSRAFCNDCDPAYRQMMAARGRCMTKEINGKDFEPFSDDEADFA